MTEKRSREIDIAVVAKHHLLNDDRKPSGNFWIAAEWADNWLEAIVRLNRRCEAYEKALVHAKINLPSIDERPTREIEAEHMAKLRDLGVVT